MSTLKVDSAFPTTSNGSLTLYGNSGGSATSTGITIDSTGTTAIDYTGNSKGTFKGIEAVVWRMINTETAGDQDPLGKGGADWELSDDTENELYLGSSTQVTESGTGAGNNDGGIFSFATTGWYWITFYGLGDNSSGGDARLYGNIHATNDNSTYSIIARGVHSASTDNFEGTASCSAIIKVTNTTNDKIKFSQDSASATGFFEGDTAKNITYAVFVKLADI